MAKEYSVVKLKEEHFDLWDRFVDNSDQGTVFHKSFWLAQGGYDFLIYCCTTGDFDIAGGMILFVKHIANIKYTAQAELTPYSGILLKKQSGKEVKANTFSKKVTAALLEEVGKDGLWLVRTNLIYTYRDLQPFKWMNYSCELRYTYILKNDKADVLWKGIEDKRKTDINRAVKSNLTIEIGEDNITEFIQLNKETFKRQNLKPPVSEEQIMNYHKVLKDRGSVKIFIAKTGKQEPCAAAYIVYDHKRAYYLMAGIDYSMDIKGASSFVLWEAIKYSFEVLNLEEFDFEGTDEQSREKFFREFGGSLVPYFRVYKWKSTMNRCVFNLLKGCLNFYRRIKGLIYGR